MGDVKCSTCPKGKYMFANCNATLDTVCKTCPRRTFIDEENKLSQCRACRECSSTSNMEMVKECEEDKNTQCRCKPGYYCTHISESHCDNCSPVSTCPPGQGVAIRQISLSHISPVFPPDILKYPADCDVEKNAEHQQLTHLVGKYPDMDSSIQCDGFLPTLTVSEKYRPSAAANGYTDSITCHSNYQSEPQESEWND
ncbi:hypothetical protein cypCar_00025009 [Cyprinus carpio]|nr:hypothetical protein cypCar_00025009 [Cyprinus carpio]